MKSVPPPGHDFQQPASRVYGVIIAEITVGKEHVAAHFASQDRFFFLQFLLDQRVAGSPHDGAPAVGVDVVVHRVRAFDFADKSPAGVAFEDVAGENEHEHIAVDDVSFFVHHADAVGVAVKADAQLQSFPDHRFRQGGHVFGDGGVGLVIGKVAVHFKEQLVSRTSQPFQEWGPPPRLRCRFQHPRPPSRGVRC